MIVRWSLLLAVILGISAVSMSALVFLNRAVADDHENVRQSRVDQQLLEQQLLLLSSAQVQELIADLDEDIDTLKLNLAEALLLEPFPPAVLSVEYVQSVPPVKLQTIDGESISTLRLEVSMTLQHSLGLISLLSRVGAAVDTWPHEIRACKMNRVAEERLTANCVIDFYHWRVNRTAYDAYAREKQREIDAA